MLNIQWHFKYFAQRPNWIDIPVRRQIHSMPLRMPSYSGCLNIHGFWIDIRDDSFMVGTAKRIHCSVGDIVWIFIISSEIMRNKFNIWKYWKSSFLAQLRSLESCNSNWMWRNIKFMLKMADDICCLFHVNVLIIYEFLLNIKMTDFIFGTAERVRYFRSPMLFDWS
jgi:hypothetical protein